MYCIYCSWFNLGYVRYKRTNILWQIPGRRVRVSTCVHSQRLGATLASREAVDGSRMARIGYPCFLEFYFYNFHTVLRSLQVCSSQKAGSITWCTTRSRTSCSSAARSRTHSPRNRPAGSPNTWMALAIALTSATESNSLPSAWRLVNNEVVVCSSHCITQSHTADLQFSYYAVQLIAKFT